VAQAIPRSAAVHTQLAEEIARATIDAVWRLNPASPSDPVVGESAGVLMDGPFMINQVTPRMINYCPPG
jgi:hypothetical protein